MQTKQSRTAAWISGRRLSFRSLVSKARSSGARHISRYNPWVGSILAVAGGGEVAVARHPAGPRRRIHSFARTRLAGSSSTTKIFFDMLLIYRIVP